MRRAVSHIVAVFAVLAIVVGTVIYFALIVNGMVGHSVPKRSQLIISGGRAFWSGDTLYIELIGNVIGSSAIRIAGVYLVGTLNISGVEREGMLVPTLLAPSTSTYFQPGSMIKITLSYDARGVNIVKNADIEVHLNVCDVNNNCDHVVYIVKPKLWVNALSTPLREVAVLVLFFSMLFPDHDVPPMLLFVKRWWQILCVDPCVLV